MRAALLTICLLAAAARTVEAQEGLALLTVVPEKHFFEGSATAYDLFGPLEQLNLELALGNQESSRRLLLEPGWIEAIRWHLESATSQSLGAAEGSRQLPLQLAAVREVTCGGTQRNVCQPSSRISVDPDEWVRVRLSLRPVDATIAPGEYRLVADASTQRALLLEVNESPWTGRIISSGAIRLRVRRIAAPADRAKYHEIEAADAIRREDYAKALSEFRLMNAVKQGDVNAEVGMGNALLHLGRFAEAAAALEMAWKRGPDRHVGATLALAYVAVGRTNEADALVRRLYSPEAAREVSERIRQSAAALPRQPR